MYSKTSALTGDRLGFRIQPARDVCIFMVHGDPAILKIFIGKFFILHGGTRTWEHKPLADADTTGLSVRYLENHGISPASETDTVVRSDGLAWR